MRVKQTVVALALLAGAGAAAAEEWPQWRGPRDDGIVRDAKIAESWPAEGPKRLWEAQVGVGFSSPVAVDGKVYVFQLRQGVRSFFGNEMTADDVVWSWEKSYAQKRTGLFIAVLLLMP